MPRSFDRGDGVRLAFEHVAGAGPLIVFLPGYLSDMAGTKAEHMAGWARARGRAFVRLDYSGCGVSGGVFEAGSIGRWAADARAVVDHVAPGRPLLLVGSSMGGWTMLRLALDLGPRVAGLVGIAAAPDFDRWGLALTGAEREGLAAGRPVERASSYGPEPYRYWPAFIEDASRQRMLEAPLPIAAPARLLHGQRDDDVPWEVSVRLMSALTADDVRLTLVKDGDHRLSRPADLVLLEQTLEEWPC